MAKKKVKLTDISKNPNQLHEINLDELMPLPFDCGGCEKITPLTDEQKEKWEHSLDGVSALNLPKPQTKEEEEKLVQSFLNGLEKLLSKEDNWTFLLPLKMSLEYCGKCNVCNEACPVHVGSGRQDIYRPTYRSEILRRIIKKYTKHGKSMFPGFSDGDIELNWTTIARLAELANRCTICRRCAQTCVRGVDNALLTRELRKVFSQEMGIAAESLHEKGTLQQLQIGASTGLNPRAFADIVEFMEDDIEEKLGRRIKIPVDKEGAEILLIHNTGEYVSWMQNPEAFAILFDIAGIDYTLSSEIGGYEGTNYGLWYDDLQAARIVIQQVQAAKKLGVTKIVAGECGHEHKAMMVIADRLLNKDMYIPRESCFPLLEEIVFSGKLNLDPSKNDFPVTLHDPCNYVRLMGIVEPQRRILRHIAPQFREMTPHGVHNYCCGGGSGFAINNSSKGFIDWKLSISSRMKVKQMLEAFGEENLGPGKRNFVCTPCSNCKGQIRDLISYYDLQEKYGIYYDGLVELIVNAMVDLKEPFLEWDDI